MSATLNNSPRTIIGLKVENFKRINAVDISLHNGETIVAISGANAQGKSSLLDAIWSALCSAEANRATGTSKPVRDGAGHARVQIDFGDIIVTRTWNSEGTSKLEIMSADTGAKFSSPQKLLDSLLGRLSFDPLAFTRMSSKDQVTTLLSVVDLGIDLDAVAAQRKDIFDRRTQVGRDITALGTLPEVHPAMPTVEESPMDLITEISAAQAAVSERNSNIARAEHLTSKITTIEAQIAELIAQKKAAEEELVTVNTSIDQAPEVNIDALTQRLARVEETNQAIRANNKARETVAAAEALQDTRDALTREIEELDQMKADALSQAQFPLDGLSFNENGITFNGIPVSQASTAEQLRISCALAISLNPSIRVLRVTDGSLLDSSSMKVLEELADEHNFQIWMELVDETGTVGIVIEDGAVKAIN